MRHAARARAGARQARGRTRAARARAPARGAAADAPAAGRRCRCRRRTARARSASRSTCTRTRRSSSTSDGRASADPADAEPLGRRGHARRARGRARARRRGRDQPRAEEVPWTAPLDEDEEHATYDPGAGRHLPRGGDARRARARRAPRPLPRAQDAGQRLVGLLRPRGQPVLGASGRPAVAGLHHAERDGRRRRSPSAGGPATPATRSAAFYVYVHPAPDRLREAALAPGRWDAALGEYLLDWDDVIAAPDPHAVAGGFLLDAVRHACAVCAWDPELAASVDADPVINGLRASSGLSPRLPECDGLCLSHGRAAPEPRDERDDQRHDQHQEQELGDNDPTADRNDQQDQEGEATRSFRFHLPPWLAAEIPGPGASETVCAPESPGKKSGREQAASRRCGVGGVSPRCRPDW